MLNCTFDEFCSKEDLASRDKALEPLANDANMPEEQEKGKRRMIVEVEEDSDFSQLLLGMSAYTSSVKTGRNRDAAASEDLDELEVYRGWMDARCSLSFGSSRSLFSRRMDLGFQGLASQQFVSLFTTPDRPVSLSSCVYI